MTIESFSEKMDAHIKEYIPEQFREEIENHIIEVRKAVIDYMNNGSQIEFDYAEKDEPSFEFNFPCSNKAMVISDMVSIYMLREYFAIGFCPASEDGRNLLRKLDEHYNEETIDNLLGMLKNVEQSNMEEISDNQIVKKNENEYAIVSKNGKEIVSFKKEDFEFAKKFLLNDDTKYYVAEGKPYCLVKSFYGKGMLWGKTSK